MQACWGLGTPGKSGPRSTHVKMSSMKQAVLISSRSLRSLAISALLRQPMQASTSCRPGLAREFIGQHTHVKMSSMRQAMVIFSRSLRSLATSAGCALSFKACLEHKAS